MAEYKEMLGKKFHIVPNGLDPNEVNEYLLGEAGSSDSVFKQLEQFSALKAATKTIDDAIKQARELAEHAKVKANAEAEQKKAQAVEEAKQLAAKIINEAGTSVLSYFDSASAVMMEAINEALKKAKEQVTMNRAKTREKIERLLEKCDMVKFAKYVPSRNDLEALLPVAREIVEITWRPRVVEDIMSEQKEPEIPPDEETREEAKL